MRVHSCLLALTCLWLGGCDHTEGAGPRAPVVSPAVTPAPGPEWVQPVVAHPKPVATPVSASAPCDRPELWLALYPRKQLATRYCAVCADQSAGACDPTATAADPRLAWGLLHESDDGIASRYGCNDLTYVALAIGAFHGQPVTDPIWLPYFERQRWYRPQTSGSASQLPATAVNNRQWIEGRRDACLATTPQVSAGDWQVVRDWFRSKDAGHPPLPAQLFLDGRSATPAAFGQFIASPGLYQFDQRTPARYDAVSPPVGIVGRDRTVVIPTGDPGISCLGLGEECEGFEWLEMHLDAQGRIVALSASAAACPFVYAAHDRKPLAFQGEILRNLRRPELATSQTLALPAVTACNAPIRVRLEEKKPETTFLDSVALRIDGVDIPPDGCRANGPRYCVADGVPHILRHGETLDLIFSAPKGIACRNILLHASGYYLPGA